VGAEAVPVTGVDALRERRQRERAGDRQVRRNEPGRADVHHGEGQTEPPGRDRAGEVRLVADQQVRPPLPAAVGDVRGAPLRRLAGRPSAEIAELPLAVDGQQRLAHGRLGDVLGIGRHRREPMPFHHRDHRRTAGECDGVTGCARRARDSDERHEVPGAPDEREQDPHACDDMGWRCGLSERKERDGV
jgi:hypothetical protein